MLGIGNIEIACIILVVLVVFGPEKIPDMAVSLGKFLRAFNRMKNDVTRQLTEGLDEFERAETRQPSPSAVQPRSDLPHPERVVPLHSQAQAPQKAQPETRMTYDEWLASVGGEEALRGKLNKGDTKTGS